jgi:hypothetical protein
MFSSCAAIGTYSPSPGSTTPTHGALHAVRIRYSCLVYITMYTRLRFTLLLSHLRELRIQMAAPVSLSEWWNHGVPTSILAKLVVTSMCGTNSCWNSKLPTRFHRASTTARRNQHHLLMSALYRSLLRPYSLSISIHSFPSIHQKPFCYG